VKNKIINLCKDYNINIKNYVDFNQPICDIINHIERQFIYKNIKCKHIDVLMAKIWKLQIQYDNDLLCESQSFRDIMNDVFNNTDYYNDGNCIVSDSIIHCKVIQSRHSSFYLNSDQSTELIKLGYGITQIRIKKNKNITEVYCKGKHPNLNKKSNQFCLDPEFLSIELNKNSLCLLKGLLSHFNLKDCFLSSDDKQKIMEIVK
jgi:hypothetical protein